MRITFNLNKTKVQIEADSNERLVNVLRREFGLISLKKSDYTGLSGSCVVLLNETPVPASIIPIFKVEGKEIITLEYFTKTPEYKTIITAFRQAGVQMCGYCNSGKIFAFYKILQSGEKPDKDKINNFYNTKLCRCTSSNALIDAIKKINLK